MTELTKLIEGKDDVSLEMVVKFCAERFQLIQDINNNELIRDVYSLDQSESNIYKIKIKGLKERLQFFETSPIDVLMSAFEESKRSAEREAKIQSIAQLSEQLHKLLGQLKQWEPDEKGYQDVKKYCIESVQVSIEKDCDINRFFPDNELSLNEWVSKEIASIEATLSSIQTRIDKELEYLSKYKKFYNGLNESLRSISTDTPK